MKNSLSNAFEGPRAGILLATPLALLACREVIKEQVHYVYVDTGQAPFAQEDGADVEVIFPEDTATPQDTGVYGDDGVNRYPMMTRGEHCEDFFSRRDAGVREFSFYNFSQLEAIPVSSGGMGATVFAYPDINLRSEEVLFLCTKWRETFYGYEWNVGEWPSETYYRRGTPDAPPSVEWSTQNYPLDSTGEFKLYWGIYNVIEDQVYWRADLPASEPVVWSCLKDNDEDVYGLLFDCEDEMDLIDF